MPLGKVSSAVGDAVMVTGTKRCFEDGVFVG